MSAIFLVAVILSLACVGGRFLAARPLAYPVALSMTGYKADAGYDPKILFQITNRTASEVRFQYHYDATNTSGLTSGGAGVYDLQAHGAGRLFMVAQGGTNGWRVCYVFSASRLRSQWQQQIDSWISRAGLHPVFAAWERAYPQRTNVWTTP
jgi:hypothetical protein